MSPQMQCFSLSEETRGAPLWVLADQARACFTATAGRPSSGGSCLGLTAEQNPGKNRKAVYRTRRSADNTDSFEF